MSPDFVVDYFTTWYTRTRNISPKNVTAKSPRLFTSCVSWTPMFFMLSSESVALALSNYD